MIVLAVTVIGAGSRKVVDIILNMAVALPWHFAATGGCAGRPRCGGLLSKEFRCSRKHRCNRRNLAKKTSPSVSFHEYPLNVGQTGASQHRRQQVGRNLHFVFTD